MAVDRVTVTDQISRRFIPGKRFDDLLRCPRSRRTSSDVEVNYLAPGMTQDDEAEQHTKGGRGHCEKVNGGNVRCVILQKRSPRL